VHLKFSVSAESPEGDLAYCGNVFFFVIHVKPVKLKIAELDEVYFFTITCFKWLSLSGHQVPLGRLG
jgi:hypothetical protein